VKKAIQLDMADNVATMTLDVIKGEEVEVLSPQGKVILRTKPVENIIFGHKISLKNIKTRENIIKYGEILGVASQPIKLGEWVHTHNLESGRLPTSKLEENA
jgi:hypothetical protein